MKLETALDRLEGRELDAALGFWNQDRHAWPVGEAERRHMLINSLTSRPQIEARLSQLPSRLRDLLIYVIRDDSWSETFDLRRFDVKELPIDEFELIPVGTALAERGFFVSQRVPGGGQRGTSFCVAEELGSLLEEIFNKSKKPVDASLTLRAYLRFVERSDLVRRLETFIGEGAADLGHAEVLRRLTDPESIRQRVETLNCPQLKAHIDDLPRHAGILDGDARRRLDVDADEDKLKEWGGILEENLLGSFESSELTNHGLSCREGWLVFFDEIVSNLLGSQEADQDEAAADLQRGGDPVADLRGIISDSERTSFKVKKTGEYYKTGVRRMAKEALSAGSPPQWSRERSSVVLAIHVVPRADLSGP